MKVIYKKGMVEKIVEAVQEAEAKGKQVDKIEITPSEATELRCEMNVYPREPRIGFMGNFFGVRIFVVKEDKEF